MQDEVNEKTIALYIKTGKLTAQTLQKAMKAILSKGKKQLAKPPQGKQSLKQLMKQNAGVSNIWSYVKKKYKLNVTNFLCSERSLTCYFYCILLDVFKILFLIFIWRQGFSFLSL